MPFHKLTFFLFFGAAMLSAQDPECEVMTTAEAGWTNLSATAQWRGGVGAPFPAAAWKVDSACLVLTNPRAGGSLYSNESYDNFELVFDWRLAAKGNSGVKYMGVPGRIHPDFYTIFVRWHLIVIAGMLFVLLVQIWALRRRISILSTRPGFALGVVICSVMAILIAGDIVTVVSHWRTAGNHPPGLEYQLIDDVGNEDARYGPTHQTGALYDILPPRQTHLNPPGQFNSSRILVRGNHAEHWLNGVKVLEYEFDSPVLIEALGKSKFKGLPELARKSPGLLELQNHGAVIAFRSMRIRRVE